LQVKYHPVSTRGTHLFPLEAPIFSIRCTHPFHKLLPYVPLEAPILSISCSHTFHWRHPSFWTTLCRCRDGTVSRGKARFAGVTETILKGNFEAQVLVVPSLPLEAPIYFHWRYPFAGLYLQTLCNESATCGPALTLGVPIYFHWRHPFARFFPRAIARSSLDGVRAS